MFGGKRCRSPSLHPATFKENVSSRVMFVSVAVVYLPYRVPYVYWYGSAFGLVCCLRAYPQASLPDVSGTV